MRNEQQDIIEKGLNENLDCKEILSKVMALDNFLDGGKGCTYAFVEYQSARLGGVTGCKYVQEKDLVNMPHNVTISATRPHSLHIELIGYTDHFGPVRDGWPEIVERYKKQMHDKNN
jgi:hypothetical protein